MIATIYMPLVGEADVWRPVEAEWVTGSHYRIVGTPVAGEKWAFPHGAVVVIVQKKLENGLVWTADRLAK